MKLKHKKEGELNQKAKSQITKKYQEKNNKLQKGITLIALVITIIVLLILAGVSIATLTGDNGILTKAQMAKEETQNASEEEQRQLAILNASMNTENYDYPVEDGKITIPAGFAPTGIEGENTIKDGVVITDENGNEFVWIPCGIDVDTSKEITDKGEINYNAKRSKNWQSCQYFYNGGTWGDSQPNKDEIQKSIQHNGGFYVARYEAGIPNEATEIYANSDGAPYKQSAEKNTDKYIPVSKRGVQAWNFINQKNAKTVSENMVKNNGVKSYLIDSHAWDTTCRVIKKYDGKNLTDSTEWGNYYNNKTTKYENINTLYAVHKYNNSDNGWTYAKTYSKGQVKVPPKDEGENQYALELSTGASDDFKAYNIYDFAGNLSEVTTENGNKPDEDNGSAEIPDIGETDIDNAKNCVFCGGSATFEVGNEVYMVVGLNSGNLIDNTSVLKGFRVVLYLET